MLFDVGVTDTPEAAAVAVGERRQRGPGRRFGPDGADLVIVPDSGHQIALENADAFSRVVGDVLARGR